MSTTLNKPIDSFKEWKTSILMEVKKRLDSSKSYKYKILHRNSDGEKALKRLQEDFVLVPLDKAGNNIAIICKYYYISTLKEEITSANFTAVNSNMPTSSFSTNFL